MRQNMVLITGATGFLGRHLVSAFQHHGYLVVANARNRVAEFEPHRWVLGDLRDEKVQEAAVRGCTFVVNAAGLVKKVAPDGGWEKDMFQLNCEMAESLARVSERAGVARFLQVSSTGVYGPRAPQICHEGSECLPDDVYEKSKWAGERRLAALANGSMQIIIARPSNIFGEWHSWNKLLSWMQAVQSGKVVLAGDPERASVNYVYVRDVVEVAIQLLESPAIKSGEVFNINTPATMGRFYQATAKAIGCPDARARAVPKQVLAAAAIFLDCLSRVTAKKFPLSMDKFWELAGNRVFSSEHLASVCPDFPQTGLEEGLSRLTAHYRARGLL
ncbi:MAG: NAD(P)-dependent oxidoreductase [Opitutaceae bacterium]